MNLYQSLGRWYVQFDWDEWFGLRFAFGRHASPDLMDPGLDDQYAADDVPHPFADPDALQGHVTAPAGAQDFQVVYDEAGGESGWSGQTRDGS